MTDSGGDSSRSLFAGTAWYYARHRPSYPSVFFDDVVHRFHLDGTGRLLDLGCGTGQLTIPLAPHFAEAVGMDPEPDMLAQAASQAFSTGRTNLTWIPGSSADLPGKLGRFRLVTMGRSFHWMNREHVVTALADMVQAGGGIVIANDGCLVRPSTAWQRAIEEAQDRFLGPIPRVGDTSAADTCEPHEKVLARSAFRRIDQLQHTFERTWTVQQIIGYLYSTSLPIRQLLGDQRTTFEHAVIDALHAIDQSGHFTELVTLKVLAATKDI